MRDIMFRQLAKKIPFPILPVLYIFSGLILSFVSLRVFLELSEELMEEQRMQLDSNLLHYVSSMRSETLTIVMRFITDMGSVTALTILLVSSLVWLTLKRRNFFGAVFYLIAVAGGGLINLGLKHWFGRVRPEGSLIVENGFSYPSGHSMGSLIYYGFLGYLVIKSQHDRWLKTVSGIIFMLLILFIGFSRIYLGVHYPTDVLAGFSAGTVWLLLCIAALESIQIYRKKMFPLFNRKHPGK
jgi:membrane-associated phospholipid phosphatase